MSFVHGEPNHSLLPPSLVHRRAQSQRTVTKASPPGESVRLDSGSVIEEMRKKFVEVDSESRSEFQPPLARIDRAKRIDSISRHYTHKETGQEHTRNVLLFLRGGHFPPSPHLWGGPCVHTAIGVMMLLCTILDAQSTQTTLTRGPLSTLSSGSREPKPHW